MKTTKRVTNTDLVLKVFITMKGEILSAQDVCDYIDYLEKFKKLNIDQVRNAVWDLVRNDNVETVGVNQFRYLEAKIPESRKPVVIESPKVKISMDEMLALHADKDKTQNYIRFHLGRKMNLDYTLGIKLGLGLVQRLGWNEGISLNWIWDPNTVTLSLFPHEDERNSKLMKNEHYYTVGLEMVHGHGLPKPKPGEENDVCLGIDCLKVESDKVIVCFKGSRMLFS